MKAVLCTSLDGIESLTIEDIDPPSPGAGEVVVKVRAAALNFFDTLITRGAYQHKPELPFSPSGEICGTVLSCGPDVKDFSPGDRVMSYLGWGGAREQVLVQASQLVPVPDTVADEVAASLSITYGTAIHGLRDRAGLVAGETVAILGAAGGAGLAAIEIAKQLGAHVIAVASSKAKLDTCVGAGADQVFDYKTGDLKAGLRTLTSGRGVDVVYDCVGGDQTEQAIRAMAWGGRFLVVGFASGTIAKLPLNLLLVKGVSAVGVFWGEAIKRDPDSHRANMEQLMDWVARGKLVPVIDQTFPLESAREALGVIAQRKAIGKVVLVVE